MRFRLIIRVEFPKDRLGPSGPRFYGGPIRSFYHWYRLCKKYPEANVSLVQMRRPSYD